MVKHNINKRNKIDIESVNAACLQNFATLLEYLQLNGEYRNNEFVAINPKRNDSELGSFSINKENGRWADFAVADKSSAGSDLISLAAYIADCNYYKAARDLHAFFQKQSRLPNIQQNSPLEKAFEDLQIMPIPVNAPPWKSFISANVHSKYVYHDSLGNIIGYILRIENASGKQFRPLTLWQSSTGKPKWQYKGFTSPKPLYNLHLIHQHTQAPILLVEGEKAADAAINLFPGYVVVTTMNGAQAAGKADLTPLIGRKVYIWPDNDEAGRIYASKVSEMLLAQEKEASVWIMEPINYAITKRQGASDVLKRIEGQTKGWDAADAVAEGWTVHHIMQLPDEIWKKVENGPKVFRAGSFYVNEQGVFQDKKSNDGDVISVQVASPIWPVAITRNENDKNWGLLLEIENPSGKLHTWAMPQELLSGSGELCRTQLLNLGAKIYSKDALSQFLMAAKPNDFALCTEVTGWHKNLFILPDRTYGQFSERVVVQNTRAHKQTGFGTNGTLEEWQANVANKCVGNSRLVFAVCISLAGAFLKLMDEENGGFHLRGPSSSGKTKTLSVAASVWGGKKMVHAWRTTGNAIESLALEHNDSVLILDELGQVSPGDAGDIAYMLGNGQQKARSNRMGDARDIARWRLLFISTGEIGLAEHVNTVGTRIRAGQEIRMLDIPSDGGVGLGVFENIHQSPSPQNFADDLQVCSEKFYGTAAEALLTKLTGSESESNDATNFVKRYQLEFVNTMVAANSHGQLFRAANRFGLVAGVGEYCIESGILSWKKGEAVASAKKCYLSWLEARGGAAASEEIRALNQVQSFFELHAESRFTLISHYEDNIGQRTVNRAGFKTVLDNGEVEYWVLPEAYKSQICNGFDPKLVTSILVERGYLKLDSAGKPQLTKRLPGTISPSRVYVFNSTIFNGNNEV